MNLRKMRKNSLLRRSTKKNYSKKKRENNWPNSIKNPMLSLKRKPSRRKPRSYRKKKDNAAMYR